MKKMVLAVSLIVGGFSLIGGLWAFDCTYTRAEDHRQLKQRIDRRLLMDDARDLERRMWDMERYYTPAKAQQMREYQEIKSRRDMMLRELGR